MHTSGLYDRLLDAAREIAPASPEKGIEIALLALAVANELDPQQYREARTVDLKQRRPQCSATARESPRISRAHERIWIRLSPCSKRAPAIPWNEQTSS